MPRLTDELHRLYAPDKSATSDNQPATTRAMLLAFTRNADWEHVSGLFRDIQVDLELPAPALSVSASNGYAMWFSLQSALPLAEATAFLGRLRRRYLAELPDGSIVLQPAPGSACLTQVPAEDAASGKWSAFIDPGMGVAFVDEAGLDMPPNPERQADLLAGLESISPAAFRQAAAKLAAGDAVATAPPPAAAQTSTASAFPPGGPFTDPASFLLAAMNDPRLSMSDRIAAAAALLPRFPAT